MIVIIKIMGNLIFILLCCCLFWFLWKFVLSKFKSLKIGNLVLVVGGVKTGKSTLSVYMTIFWYKARIFVLKFKNFFLKLFKKQLYKLPVIYSNVPLNVDYVPLTREMLLGEERGIPGSIVYLQEASLLADSQLIKDKDLNNALLKFFKLCGHYGLTVICDTQSTSDLHYSVKRSLSQIFYVRHTTKWIPFFIIVELIEYMYSEDGSIIFSQNADTDELVKRVIIPKSIWKKFDSRTYRGLIENKPPVHNSVVKKGTLSDLKAHRIISFRPEFNIDIDKENEKKEDIK